MRRAILIAGLAWLFFAAPAEAAGSSAIVARIDISDQQMRVYVNGFPRYSWAVSTAARGYRTPLGTYRPQRMHTMWYSRKYDNAPMPHSIFFVGGYAVHGTPHIRNLGRPASHGCVRLAPANAARLYQLVKRYGMSNARIVLVQ